MKAVTDFLKKYWKYILAAVLLIVAIIFLWRREPKPLPPDNTVVVHQFDSLKYVKSNDSLKVVISTLEQEIVKRGAEYALVVAKYSKKIGAVQNLPKTEVVEEFSNRIYVDVELKPDSNVIVPIQGIRNALVLIYERDAAIEGLHFYSGQDSLKTSVIEKQKELLGIKDNRIVKLTSEFYQSQTVITGLRADVEKANKKVRNRNTWIGIGFGAAAAGVLVAIIKP